MLTPWRRLAIGCLAAIALACVGVVGYMAIEGFTFFDAVYQTVTTITTAGFGEVEPLSGYGARFHARPNRPRDHSHPVRAQLHNTDRG